MNGQHTRKVGREPILSCEEESHLVDIIKRLQEYNHPVSNGDVIQLGRLYLLELKKNIPESCPTKDWFYSFMKRWSDELKMMKSVKLEKCRSDALPIEILDSWFNKLYVLLTKLQLFDKPACIFNCDESSFCEDPGTKSVVVKRDTRYPNAIHGGSGKEQTTVLLYISARGR
ncbi:unnamed protein product [Didymodactylos carnosus]|uniref:HTH CENPB-type domain-containing protein n=1 Tax=Didymodactylos carnosus TaxID=1234261 RepID=A0A814SP65_9BILA|nr:unnamed protein product [Didymodactylos carnosus]CAF3914283.1 unnamed protein product [Didymodactylos carnosus]